MNAKFIKKIKRIEIKRWIETLRELVTMNETDYCCDIESEEVISLQETIVAVKAKIVILYRLRNKRCL